MPLYSTTFQSSCVRICRCGRGQEREERRVRRDRQSQKKTSWKRSCGAELHNLNKTGKRATVRDRQRGRRVRREEGRGGKSRNRKQEWKQSFFWIFISLRRSGVELNSCQRGATLPPSCSTLSTPPAGDYYESTGGPASGRTCVRLLGCAGIDASDESSQRVGRRKCTPHLISAHKRDGAAAQRCSTYSYLMMSICLILGGKFYFYFTSTFFCV